jgi:hypothetical protein
MAALEFLENVKSFEVRNDSDNYFQGLLSNTEFGPDLLKFAKIAYSSKKINTPFTQRSSLPIKKGSEMMEPYLVYSKEAPDFPITIAIRQLFRTRPEDYDPLTFSRLCRFTRATISVELKKVETEQGKRKKAKTTTEVGVIDVRSEICDPKEKWQEIVKTIPDFADFDKEWKVKFLDETRVIDDEVMMEKEVGDFRIVWGAERYIEDAYAKYYCTIHVSDKNFMFDTITRKTTMDGRTMDPRDDNHCYSL